MARLYLSKVMKNKKNLKHEFISLLENLTSEAAASASAQLISPSWAHLFPNTSPNDLFFSHLLTSPFNNLFFSLLYTFLPSYHLTSLFISFPLCRYSGSHPPSNSAAYPTMQVPQSCVISVTSQPL